MALLDIAEYIGTQGDPSLFLELLLHLIYMGVVRWLAFYGDNASTATRNKLQTDATCTGKEVKNIGALLEVDEVIKYIEEILLGEVRCRTCLKVAWHLKGAALIFTTDYSHAISV